MGFNLIAKHLARIEDVKTFAYPETVVIEQATGSCFPPTPGLRREEPK
jgi:hypothetical protein